MAVPIQAILDGIRSIGTTIGSEAADKKKKKPGKKAGKIIASLFVPYFGGMNEMVKGKKKAAKKAAVAEAVGKAGMKAGSAIGGNRVPVAAKKSRRAGGPETMTHDETGLQFDLPAGWRIEDEDEDGLIVTDGREELMMMFAVTAARDVQAFLDDLDDEIGSLVRRPKVTNGPRMEASNGLVHYYVEGTGRIEGEPTDWDLTLIFGARKSLVILAIGEIDRHQRIVDGVYDSIRKAKRR